MLSDARGDIRLSRRRLIQAALGLGLAVPAASSILAACGDSVSVGSAPEGTPEATTGVGPSPVPGVRGGRLKVALVGEPPTLDIHQTTASITALVGWHIHEALFTWDDRFGVILELAESHEISDDGLTQVIRLRQGVPFHNGEELSAADVVASIERWAGLSGLGESLVEDADSIVEVDRYTVEFRLREPFGALPVALARQNQGCAIYSASVLDDTSPDRAPAPIGAGPYRFIDRQSDRFILLGRFEDYAALPGEPNGYGGRKLQYLDEVEFVPVPDEAARIAGLQAGNYHYLESITPDQYPVIRDHPNVVAEIYPPTSSPTLALNLKSPITGDLNLRRAIQAVLDHEPILQAGYGDGFYRLDPGVMPLETKWHSTAGAELYNRRNPEAARRLLEASSYDGSPLRFMTTEAYRDMYNTAIVIRQQLQAVGIEVDLQVFDWATLVERRNDPDLWEIYPAPATFRPDPVMRNLTCKATGWWCNEEKEELLEALQQESVFETRYQHWEAIQRLYYEDAPRIKLGDAYEVSARSPSIRNFTPLTQLQPFFWNLWLEP